MIRAHKIRLHPTPEQAQYFARAAGVARFVWNWALAEWNRHYEAGEKPTALNLKKQFNQIRREQFPWTWEITKNASDQPFLDLGQAFTAFIEGRARSPKFKSKKRSKPSFPANGPQEIAPGKQAPASQKVEIKKSGEGTQTGGTSALPHHLPASGYAPKAHDPTGRQCQNPSCPYYQFSQDRDHNAGQNVLREALRLIGLLDQAVSGTGSDADVNSAVDAG